MVARSVRPPCTDHPPSGRSTHSTCNISRACLLIVGILLYVINSGIGGLKKKLAGRFLSKRCHADDMDYNPAIDSEA
jgi:hypothetical protein